jgi:MEMO1 family protein
VHPYPWICDKTVIVREVSIIQSNGGYPMTGGSSRNAGVHSRRFGQPATGSRPSIAAGRYYPERSSTLRSLVESLLDAVDVPDGDRLAPGYLVPHAAYGASGPTAASVYARLRRHSAEIERVVVLGPRHGAALDGCVAPSADTWATPLGRTPIDMSATRLLFGDGHIRLDDEAHYVEHSLEVQLPFIQVAAPHAMIVPLLVGPASAEDVVVTLSALDDLPGTVVIVTSDLGGAATAGRTLLSILEMAPGRIGIRDACGVHALRGVLGWAVHHRLRAELLAREGDHVAFAFEHFDEIG